METGIFWSYLTTAIVLEMGLQSLKVSTFVQNCEFDKNKKNKECHLLKVVN